MYTNNAYLNNSTIDRKDKSKPLVITMCGTYKLYTRPKLPCRIFPPPAGKKSSKDRRNPGGSGHSIRYGRTRS